MKKKTAFIATALLFTIALSLLAGCKGNTGSPTPTSASPATEEPLSSQPAQTPTQVEEVSSNGAKKFVDGATVIRSGDSLFYSLENGIYCMDLDGSNNREIYLFDEESHPNPSMILIDDWIYFKMYGLYKVKTDGSGFQQVGDFTYIGSILSDGEWIYFGSEYKCKLDGSDLQQFNNKAAASGYTVNIIDDWIYYFDKNENGEDCIYKLKTDGSSKTEIYSGRADHMVVADGWIYFRELHGDNAHNIYKMKLDGTEHQLLLEESGGGFTCVTDDQIYYEADDENGKPCICKASTDGGNRQFICTVDRVDALCVIDDWIYYNADYTSLSRVKTDGSEKQVLAGT